MPLTGFCGVWQNCTAPDMSVDSISVSLIGNIPLKKDAVDLWPYWNSCKILGDSSITCLWLALVALLHFVNSNLYGLFFGLTRNTSYCYTPHWSRSSRTLSLSVASLYTILVRCFNYRFSIYYLSQETFFRFRRLTRSVTYSVILRL